MDDWPAGLEKVALRVDKRAICPAAPSISNCLYCQKCYPFGICFDLDPAGVERFSWRTLGNQQRVFRHCYGHVAPGRIKEYKSHPDQKKAVFDAGLAWLRIGNYYAPATRETFGKDRVSDVHYVLSKAVRDEDVVARTKETFTAAECGTLLASSFIVTHEGHTSWYQISLPSTIGTINLGEEATGLLARVWGLAGAQPLAPRPSRAAVAMEAEDDGEGPVPAELWKAMDIGRVVATEPSETAGSVGDVAAEAAALYGLITTPRPDDCSSFGSAGSDAGGRQSPDLSPELKALGNDVPAVERFMATLPDTFEPYKDEMDDMDCGMSPFEIIDSQNRLIEKACREKDWAFLASLYADDGRLFPPGQASSAGLCGPKEIGPFYEGLMRRGLTFLELRTGEVVAAGPDTLIETTTYSNNFGEGNYLIFWKRVHGSWRVYKALYN